MEALFVAFVSGMIGGVLSTAVAHYLKIGAEAKQERRSSLRRAFKAIDDLHSWMFDYASDVIATGDSVRIGDCPLVVLQEVVYMDFDRLDDELEKLIVAQNDFVTFVHDAKRTENYRLEEHEPISEEFRGAVRSFTIRLKEEARRKS